MSRGGGGRGGDSAGRGVAAANDQIIPATQGVRPRPKSLLSAVSEIQQFYVIEKSGDEIDGDFLTIEGVLDFFKIGAKSGFSEGLIIILLLPIMEFWLIPFVFNEPTPMVRALFIGLPYLMVLVNTSICSYVSKFYIGQITRKAINSLFSGRSMSLLIKAFLVYVIYYLIDGISTPEAIWTLAKRTSNPEHFYYAFFQIKPQIIPTGTTAAGCLVVGATLPYGTVYIRDAIRRWKIRRNQRL